MADIDRLRSYLNDIQSGMQSINDLSLEIEEQSDTLVSKIRGFSGIGTRGGIIRSIVTRASTGTGLFNITQRLTSALLVIRYIDESQKKRLKEESEFNKLMEGRDKTLRRLFEMQKKRIGVLDKEKYYNDTSVKMKLKTLSIDKAILETRENLEFATRKLRRAGRKALGQKSRRLLATQGIRGVDQFALGATGAGFLTMSGNELNAMGERQVDLISERKKIKKQFEAQEAIFDEAGTGTAKKEKAKIEMNILRDTLRQLDSTIEEVQNDIKRQALEFVQDMDEIQKETGLITYGAASGSGSGFTEEERAEQIVDAINSGNDEVVSGFQQLSFIEGIKLKLERARDKVREKMAKFGKFFKGDDLKIIKSFFQKGLMVFAGAILGMTALVAVIFALYRAGLFEWFVDSAEFFSVMWKITSGLFVEFFFASMMFLSGIIEFLVGFGQFFYGLFTGDSDLMSKSVEKMLIGFVKIIGGFAGMFSTFISALVMAAVSMAITGIGGIIAAAISGFTGSKARMAISGIGATAGIFKGAAIGSAFGPVGTIAGGVIGGVVGAGLGSGLAGVLGFAQGGITPHSGTFLVGERGPELVSLPGNTRVFNNTDTSKMMSPTININVTGRVGASDTELNDIARKIGQKINIEMNRFNSSGLRG